MAKNKWHKEVEFFAGDPGRYFKTFDEAAAAALYDAIGRESPVHLDVVIRGEAGANWWAGDEGIERYRSDPEASIFQRFKISARDIGMIP